MQSSRVEALTVPGSGPGEEGFILPVLPGTLYHLPWVLVGCPVTPELARHVNQMQHALSFDKDKLCWVMPKSRS